MARRAFLAGNWKMHKTPSEATETIKELLPLVAPVADRDIAVICPYVDLPKAAELLRGSNVMLGAQNMHQEESGAYTGEVSAPMLKEIPVDVVVIGHSERREFFNETNEACNAKIKKALEFGLIPIYCIGESLEEREAGKTSDVVLKQLREGTAGLTPDQVKTLVVAYEPIWAIGTGKTATPDQAQEVHAQIREFLAAAFGAEAADACRIQYGGSVKPSNVDELMNKPDIDGALVGGASLKAADFARIVHWQ